MKRALEWLLILVYSQAAASSLEVAALKVESGPNGPLIRPQFTIQAEAPVSEAINNGINLVMTLKSRAYQRVDWWFDRPVAKENLNLEIQYFSLSGQYVLRNPQQANQQSFVSLDELWQHLSQDLRIEFSEINGRVDYVQVRFRVDIGALPSSMQLPVLFDSAWDMDTGWITGVMP